MLAIDVNTKSVESGDEFNTHPDPCFVEEEGFRSNLQLKVAPIVQETVTHMLHDQSIRGAAQNLFVGPVSEMQLKSQVSECLPT